MWSVGNEAINSSKYISLAYMTTYMLKWSVIRTTVYLDEDVALALRHRAEVEKRTQAELIRDALRRYIEDAQESLERPPIVGIGKYQSGRSDVSERAEEFLRDAARKNRS